MELAGITPEYLAETLPVVCGMIPEFVGGCHVLPPNDRQKARDLLQLVRPYTLEDRNYLFVLRIPLGYLGGANKSEVIASLSKTHGPHFQTDRIYFNAKLLPVESTVTEQGSIVSFMPRRLKETIFETHRESTSERKRPSTILFDEPDFSGLNRKFTQMLAFDSPWQPGRVLEPFVIDYLTLCLNLVHPEREFVDLLVPHFDKVVEEYFSKGDLEGLEKSETDFWSDFYRAHACDRTLSRAGNPHWQFHSYPDKNLELRPS